MGNVRFLLKLIIQKEFINFFFCKSVIVTSTRAVNTDKISTEAVSTQTYMPRSHLNMKSVDDDELTDDESAETNREIRKIEKRFRSFQGPMKANKSVVMKRETVETISVEQSQKDSQRYDDESDDSLQGDFNTDFNKKISNHLKLPKKKVGIPQSFFQDGPTPWSNFQDMILGQRFLNARLSPSPLRQPRHYLEQVTWSEPQLQIVTGLMKEANMLLEMFDQVAMLLGILRIVNSVIRIYFFLVYFRPRRSTS